MNKTVFDLSSLIPDFSLILNGNINGGGGLSALFVLFLVIISGSFLIYAFAGFFTSTFLLVDVRIINKLKNLRRKLHVYIYNFRNLF